MNDTAGFGPLDGLKVLDIATIIAGPMVATLMADFGADVTKLELPQVGDGLRAFPPFHEGKPLWWKATNRGKRFGTLDLRVPEGKALFEEHLRRHDVLIENFRPGTLAKWGFDTERLWQINPRLVILRVTAFGQDGPYAQQPGFARVFEAMGGLTFLTGDPDRPPIHPGYPIGDVFGGLFGAFSVMAALYRIARDRPETGEEIDLSITEAVFKINDTFAIEYDQTGNIRRRNGNFAGYTAPSSVYMTRDKQFVSLSGSTTRTFHNNARAIDRPDLVDEPRYQTNVGRCEAREELDGIFGSWFASHSMDEAVEAFYREKGTLAPVLSIDRIFADPQFQARQAIATVPDDDFGTVRMQNVVPRMRNHPGRIRWSARALGADNEDIYKTGLGLSDDEFEAMKKNGAI
ncbi:CaiB/BaiF CoA transferase family protein [Paracoccus sp. (in: a-proteobacteria)]|uniref:CaiB/BaiF CoA transferase family protein n=1 Tax=Paracoccus sp. TaxID=267 RepID=UPI003A8991B7